MSGEVQIPAEAVERADIWGGQIPLGDLRESLERAAPLILAANRDCYMVAYAALHETVRRVLDGESNVKYLRKRFQDIEGDLQRAIVAGRAAVLRGEQT